MGAIDLRISSRYRPGGMSEAGNLALVDVFASTATTAITCRITITMTIPIIMTTSDNNKQQTMTNNTQQTTMTTTTMTTTTMTITTTTNQQPQN